MSETQELVVHIITPSLPNEFAGRKTVPSVGLDSPAFVYRPSIQTDLRESFRKARERLVGGAEGCGFKLAGRSDQAFEE